MGKFRLSMFMGLKGAPGVRSELTKTHQTVRRLSMATGKAAKGQRRAGQAGKALAKGSRQARTGVRGLTGALGANARKMREHVAATRRDRQALQGLRKEYRQLDRAMGKANTRQKAMGRIRRGMGRATVLGAGAGVAAISPIKAAMRTEMAEFRLSTAINFDRHGDKKQQEKERAAAVARAKKEAVRMAKAGVTTIDLGLDIQYALNSAGLTANVARAGASIAGKVAIATRGMPEEVASVLAGMFNNLGRNMAGTEAEKLKRMGDLLTQSQTQFDYRDFGQLGESMKYASATMAGLNVEITQGLNVIGALNTAGLKGSRAGTGFAAMMRGMTKAQKKWGIEMVRDNKGQLDLVATLEQVKAKTAHLSKDARQATLVKVFGSEGAEAVVPLLGNLDLLKASLAKLRKESKGVTDEHFARFAKTAQAGANRASGSLSRIGDGIGTFLLPAVEGLLWTVEKLAGALGTLAEVAPTLTTIAGGAALTGGALMVGRRFLGGRRGGKKRGLFGRGRKGRGGLGALSGAGAGAVPVMVTNWPLGGGMGMDPDVDRRKRKGKGRRGRGRGRGKFGRLRAMGRTATAARANLARRTGPLARRAVAGAAMAGMGKRAAAGAAKRAAVKSAAGVATKKAATKAAAGIAAKAVGRSVIKKIPFVSILAGLFFGAQRALAGDLAGAAMEVASGVAGTVPGAGTAASIGIDAVLAARDIAGASGPAKRTPPDQEMPTADEGWMRAIPPPAPEPLPKAAWTPWTGTIAPPKVTVNFKPVINAPGGDPQAIKNALDPSGPHFKAAVEKAVNEFFVKHQRMSMANVG